MTSLAYSKATIFGAGQVGMTLMEQLVQQGVAVTLVNRRGQAPEPLPAGATIVAGDLTDVGTVAGLAKDAEVVFATAQPDYTQWPEPPPAGATIVAGDLTAVGTVARLAKDAEVVFATAQPDYTQWPEKWPPLMQSLIGGIAQTDARLIFVDNLYMYGSTHGKLIREDLPYAATGRKGKTRAQIATMLLDAHKAGKVRATIGRASDFFGPRATDTAIFGDRFFAAAVAGKPADLFGNPDLPHTYTFVPDFARALISLSRSEEAYGRAWHVPNAQTVSTRDMVRKFETALGQPVKTRIVSPMMLSMVGLFVPIVREMKEMAYEFDEPYVVDDSHFRSAFNVQTTPLDEAVAATVAWHLSHSANQPGINPA